MNKIVNILKIANKARGIIVGEDLVLRGIRNKSVRVIILANDAGPNTTKRVTDKSSFYGIPLLTCLNSEDLEEALGKTGRKVIGVVNSGFANSILNEKSSL